MSRVLAIGGEARPHNGDFRKGKAMRDIETRTITMPRPTEYMDAHNKMNYLTE